MKKYLFILLLGFAVPQISNAQVLELIKIITTKIIKAIDLKVQQLQNQAIALQIAQKSIENNLSKTKLYEISGLVGKQKDLYKNYFDELSKVKSVISYYHRIKELVNQQKELVVLYQRGFALVKQDNHFSTFEIENISSVYTGIIDQSIRNLEQVAVMVNSFSAQVSDAERLKTINGCAEQIELAYSELQKFNRHNAQVSLGRSRDQKDLIAIKQLYGL
jgi:hypothetical protein